MASAPPASMLEAALRYAAQGQRVFPCRAKKPLIEGGFKSATRAAPTITKWWAKWPDAQVALPCGGVNHLLVIDDDGASDSDLAKLNLGETFTVETSPGHRQFWFCQPDGIKTRSSAGVLAPRIDVRGDGSYVVVPPSLHHHTGRPYRVISDLPWAPIPAGLLKLVASANGARACVTTDQIPKGRRHQTMLSIAGALRARGLSRETVLAGLASTNERLCVPPLDASEIEKVADYVAGKPAGFLGQQQHEISAEVELEPFGMVSPEAVRWLWKHRIPAGKVTLFVGDPGKGKSLVTIDVAARGSRGNAFPDGAACEQWETLILSAEDAASDTVRPRLDAADADVSRIHRIKAVKVNLADGQSGESAFSLERDLAKLEEALKKRAGIRLIVIDPLSAYLGTRVNSWRDAEVRALLTPLVDFATRSGVAVIAVMHMRKSETDAMLRVSGSIAFVAAARVVWGFGEDPSDAAQRLMVPVKNNLAPAGDALAYRIASNSDAVPYLLWDNVPHHVDANEVLGTNAKDRKEHSNRQREAEQWLRELLAGGPLSAAQVQAKAQSAGISWGTLHRAKQSVGVRPIKEGMTGGWLWAMPEGTA